MVLDATIRLGDIMVGLGMLAASLGAFWAMRGKVEGIENGLEGVQEEVKKLSAILISNAVLNEQLKEALRRITDLEAQRHFQRSLPREMREPQAKD